jgi:hypothetical protein
LKRSLLGKLNAKTAGRYREKAGTPAKASNTDSNPGIGGKRGHRSLNVLDEQANMVQALTVLSQETSDWPGSCRLQQLYPRSAGVEIGNAHRRPRLFLSPDQRHAKAVAIIRDGCFKVSHYYAYMINLHGFLLKRRSGRDKHLACPYVALSIELARRSETNIAWSSYECQDLGADVAR